MNFELCPPGHAVRTGVMNYWFIFKSCKSLNLIILFQTNYLKYHPGANGVVILLIYQDNAACSFILFI